MQLISGFVDTYLRLNEAENRVFVEAIAKIQPEEKIAKLNLTQLKILSLEVIDFENIENLTAWLAKIEVENIEEL